MAVLRGTEPRLWRCVTVRNPRGSDTLVTAGADASIKLWDLSEYEAGPLNEKTKKEDGEANATAGDRGVDAFAGDEMPEVCASRTEDARDTPRAVCLQHLAWCSWDRSAAPCAGPTSGCRRIQGRRALAGARTCSRALGAAIVSSRTRARAERVSLRTKDTVDPPRDSPSAARAGALR